MNDNAAFRSETGDPDKIIRQNKTGFYNLLKLSSPDLHATNAAIHFNSFLLAHASCTQARRRRSRPAMPALFELPVRISRSSA